MEKGTFTYLSTDILFGHPDNPRKELGDLTELVESIKANGIMQNLTVVPFVSKVNPKFNGKGRYTVIIGHRRLAAAIEAGLTEVPCIITEMTAQEQLSTMLLENMQRSDLTPYEQAQGFQMMLDLGETVSDIAEKTGFSKDTIKHRVELARLDQGVLQKVSGRQITLSDLMKLEKIEDLNKRNEVLDTIGTQNFNYTYTRAVDEQNAAKRMSGYIEKISSWAEKVDSCPDEGFKYIKAISAFYEPSEETLSAPSDAGQTQYVFKVGPRYVEIYRKPTLSDADEERKKEAERQRKADRIEIKRERVKVLNAYCRELRDAWAKKFIPSKNDYEKLLRWLFVSVCDVDVEITERDIEKRCGSFSVDAAVDTFKVMNPYKTLFELIYLNADTSNGHGGYVYTQWDGKIVHDDNSVLDIIYDMLEDFGYEMSDEEKALKDGTHPIFTEEGDEEDVR